MTNKKDNPLVSRAFCDERFKRVETLYNNIDEKLEEIREDRKAWKSWSLGIASSIMTGVVLYFLTSMG